MKLEIERKFLVKTEVHFPPLSDEEHILQGYISRKPVVRVRVVDNKTGWLTLKGKGTVSRPEYEYEIPVADARDLMTLCEYTIEKVRYKVRFEGFLWELDQFKGPHLGLWLAEIELPTEGTVFQKPSWVGNEVSEDPRYTNVSLAEMRRAP